MKLDRIKVSGFKSFKEIDLELRSLNVLIGANGSGKSNFISLFRMLNDMVRPEVGLQFYIAKSGRADVLLHYGKKVTQFMSVEVEFDASKYIFSLAASPDDSMFFTDERALFSTNITSSNTTVTPIFTIGHKETKLLEIRPMGSDDGIQVRPEVYDWFQKFIAQLRDWKVFHFHDTSDSAAVKRSSYIYDNKYLRSEGENLAAFLYLLKQEFPKSYEAIRSTVQMVAPFFDDFVFQLLPGQDNHVKLDWREKGSDYPFQVFQLSDGTLRFICLATVLNLPDEYLPSAILIDEPEMGLHPFALEVLASLIRKAAFRTQIIVSTQSVSLVNLFEAEDLLVVERQKGASVIRRLPLEDLQDWLERYSLGDLWEKNVLGGRPTR